MSFELVDIGANLTHESFAADLSQVLERASKAGVAQIVATAASEAGSREALELAQWRAGILFATAGVHPHHASEWAPGSANNLAEIAANIEVVAIGETGLDFNRNYSPPAAQRRAFEAQLELAAAVGLPVFMHERDAHSAFIDILARYRDRLPRAVVHCFTGSEDELRAYVDMDLYIGITGWICDERRGHHLRDMLHRIPDNRLLLETDAPYLLPRDMTPRPRSRRNEPAHLAHIAGAVADSLGVSRERLAARTTRNARTFFAFGSLLDSDS